MVSQEQLARTKMLVCGVDGVLTDGTITYGSNNFETKTFNTRDGLAMKLAGWGDFPVAWITGRISNVINRRADELNVQVYSGLPDKEVGMRMVTRDFGVIFNEIVYVGDDINDLPAMRLAGLPVAVANAAPEVIAAACFVTKAAGGQGAIREILEYVLRAQGRWDTAVVNYLANLRGDRVALRRMPRTEE
jgi:3-deoxy-D-manno-octulosonate 8-phosphate phosphatase (KDO 8-P phosphatase)